MAKHETDRRRTNWRVRVLHDELTKLKNWTWGQIRDLQRIEDEGGPDPHLREASIILGDAHDRINQVRTKLRQYSTVISGGTS